MKKTSLFLLFILAFSVACSCGDSTQAGADKLSMVKNSADTVSAKKSEAIATTKSSDEREAVGDKESNASKKSDADKKSTADIKNANDRKPAVAKKTVADSSEIKKTTTAETTVDKKTSAPKTETKPDIPAAIATKANTKPTEPKSVSKKTVSAEPKKSQQKIAKPVNAEVKNAKTDKKNQTSNSQPKNTKEATRKPAVKTPTNTTDKTSSAQEKTHNPHNEKTDNKPAVKPKNADNTEHSKQNNSTASIPKQHPENKSAGNEPSTQIQNNDTNKNKTQTKPADKTEAAFVAIVSFCKGRNKILRASGVLERCKTNSTLVEGDKVLVSSRGRVTLVYKKTGLYKTLKPNEEFVVTAKEETAVQKVDAKKVNKAMVKNIKTSGEQPIISAVAGTRERRDPNQPLPLRQRNTYLLFSEQIQFVWEAPDLKGKNIKIAYKLHILHKGKEIYTFTTDKNSCKIEIAKAKIKPNLLYYWYVERVDMPKIATVKPLFKLLDSKKSSEIKKVLASNASLTSDSADGAPFVLNARYLAENLLYQQALDNFVTAYKLAPGDEGVIEAIRKTYKIMGFFKRDIDRFIEALKKQYPEPPE